MRTISNPKIREWVNQFDHDLQTARHRTLLPAEHLGWEVNVALEIERLHGIDTGLKVAYDMIQLAKSGIYRSRKDLVVAMQQVLSQAVDSFGSGHR